MVLFNNYNLGEYICGQEQGLKQEIDTYDENSILNAPIGDLCDYFENKYQINSLVLLKDKIYIKWHNKAGVLENGYGRKIKDKESAITYAIPFEGQDYLFYCQASASTIAPPDAEIKNQELLVTVGGSDSQKIKNRFNNFLYSIEWYVAVTNKDIMPFNQNLRKSIKEKIEKKKERIFKHLNIVSSLGYPLQQKDNPNTYFVPKVKKKIIIQKPTATSIPFVPEPALDMKNYDAILKIISSMVLVMEQSPQAFKDMGEETLRQHFLVQLNGHFEGNATGETFNYTGKTDILIREKGKNLFIAECMFWKGQKSLSEKIDQLLGYVSWRDTKTAILIFNKNKELSNVLEQIPEIVKRHKNFKRQIEYKHETGYRFVLHQASDKNRELILTILAFDIPTEILKEGGVKS